MIKKSFTLIEILIIISLIILIAIITLITLNPKKQIEKSQDSKRKTELTQLQKTLEDWYNDKNCYPRPSEICYDSPSADNTCHICGNENSSPNFSPYLSSLPCDPQHPTKKYLYQVDNLDCPKMYWLYAKFSNEDDLLTLHTNCCPENDCNYNISFTSPNASINTCQIPILSPTQTPSPTLFSKPTKYPTPTRYLTRYPTPTPSRYPTPTLILKYCRNYNILYIISNTGVCNICGNYQQCLQLYPEKTFFIDYRCTQSCIKN